MRAGLSSAAVIDCLTDHNRMFKSPGVCVHEVLRAAGERLVCVSSRTHQCQGDLGRNVSPSTVGLKSDHTNRLAQLTAEDVFYDVTSSGSIRIVSTNPRPIRPKSHKTKCNSPVQIRAGAKAAIFALQARYTSARWPRAQQHTADIGSAAKRQFVIAVEGSRETTLLAFSARPVNRRAAHL